MCEDGYQKMPDGHRCMANRGESVAIGCERHDIIIMLAFVLA